MTVALRKESVDRNNSHAAQVVAAFHVALRKESVDRNCRVRPCPVCQWRSLSARRAWIEILNKSNIMKLIPVALRKESVDRNTTRPATPPTS